MSIEIIYTTKSSKDYEEAFNHVIKYTKEARSEDQFKLIYQLMNNKFQHFNHSYLFRPCIDLIWGLDNE